MEGRIKSRNITWTVIKEESSQGGSAIQLEHTILKG